MIIQLKHVLGNQQLDRIRELFDNAKFRDGKFSAGRSAQQVKHNEELADADIIAELNHVVVGNLVRHPEYRRAALPHRIAVPFYARYKEGMRYGEHVDDPIMGEGDRYRSDIAITVFLNSPDEYQGGELVVQTPCGAKKIKYPAGDAALYAASTRHEVTLVTGGERWVAVTWVQSLVRSNERRDLLYQLGKTRERMLRQDPASVDTRRIDHVYVNLVRMWGEV